MTRKQKRLTLIISALGVLGVAVGVMLYALRDNVVFFYGPTEMAQKHVGPGVRLRIGGLVKTGTLVHHVGKNITFEVTDGKSDVSVAYTGLLPDLFREGQGVVAEGALDGGGVFQADNILAKHDERYMPREVADALKKQGMWSGDAKAANGAEPAGGAKSAGAAMTASGANAAGGASAAGGANAAGGAMK